MLGRMRTCVCIKRMALDVEIFWVHQLDYFLGTYGWSCINEFDFMVHLICLLLYFFMISHPVYGVRIGSSIKFRSRIIGLN